MRPFTQVLGWTGVFLFLLTPFLWAGPASGDSSQEEIEILQPPRPGSDHEKQPPSVVEENPAPENWKPWAIGINYIGGQVRWRPSPHWAYEGAYQQGKASSDDGDVTSHVFGFRTYRFFHARRHWSMYAGPEFAYTTAQPDTTLYKTTGFVGGVFMGTELAISQRLALDLDIGPYAIALKEKETGQSQTNLDFVIQTAFLFNLF